MSRARKTRRTTWRALHPSPIAITLDGSVLASVGLYDGTHDAQAALRTAVEHGGRVFVGVELREGEADELRRWLDDAAFECLAFVLGSSPKHRRRKRKATRDA